MNGRIKKPGEIASSIPVIGKIKVGEKNEKGLPTSLDYFKCTGKYERLFNNAYPNNPNIIQICFFSDDFNQSCNERYECRDKDGRLSGKGDGDKWYLWDGKVYQLSHDKEAIKKAGKWEMILTINFIIPKIRGVFGLFSFSTKGKASSLNNIRDSFDKVLDMAGTVVNIPFDLSVKKVISQKPGSKFKFPVVDLVPNVSTENMELLNRYIETGGDVKKLGLINENKILQLNSSNDEKQETI